MNLRLSADEVTCRLMSVIDWRSLRPGFVLNVIFTCSKICVCESCSDIFLICQVTIKSYTNLYGVKLPCEIGKKENEMVSNKNSWLQN